MTCSRIVRESIPAWYQIGFLEDGLKIDVDPSLENLLLKHLTPEFRMIKAHKETHNLPEFVPYGNAYWGYGGIMQRCASNEPWIPHVCPWPTQSKNNDWAACATLSVLFLLLEGQINHAATCTQPLQLIEIEAMNLSRSMGGAGLCVAISPRVCEWIRDTRESKPLYVIEEAMHYIHRLVVDHDHDRAFCRVWVNSPDRIHLQASNNACTLDPSLSSRESHHGYALAPHNVDTRLHQLSLLAGLAKIHDLVREWEATQ